MKWFWLLTGGAIGTLARYLLSGAVYQVWGTRFPYGTLAVNLAGCFLMGFLVVLSEEKFLPGPHIRLFLLAGFLGAFTTFSTFIYESANLIRDGQMLTALWNVFCSIMVAFFVFWLGVLLGKAI